MAYIGNVSEQLAFFDLAWVGTPQGCHPMAYIGNVSVPIIISSIPLP